ncbi:Repressible alkaline phosphatase [Paramyrothecium foliicola]|nr:Repressible alkaline phosphatase [Paramyrothecium foliicola]
MRPQVLPLALAGALLNGVDAASAPKAKNFIYVVPDGYGVNSQVLARDFYSITGGEGTVARPNTAALGVDTIVVGSVKTQASDNLVTDSAASATAFACGVKTYNGAIGVDDDGLPVASVLEAAYLKGLKTGLVVTSRITHATPACYSAHVLFRDSENEIAGHQIGHSHPFGPFVDILIGGGRRHYLPRALNGTRTDDLNLVDWAIDQGYTYAADRADYEEVQKDGKLPLPFLGLFTSSDRAYEIDRDVEKEPSLLDTVKVAINTLNEETKDSCKGYFIMVEASRIDHAGHANDATTHVHETLMYNEVMLWLKDFVDEHPDTQLLSAADHECGGLTLIDGYDPVALTRGQNSGQFLEGVLTSYRGDDLPGFLRETIIPAIGLLNYTDADIANWIAIAGSQGPRAAGTAILNAFAAEAGINWSTGGHSAADVVLYGYANGHRQEQLRDAIGGFRDNTELPGYVADALGLDLKAATQKLRGNGTDWVQKRELLASIKERANAAAHAHTHEY